MKRIICYLLLCSCAVVGLPGCGSEASEAAGDRVTLTFWHSLLATTQPALRELIDRFEAEHPNIHIDAQYIPTGDALVQKLITAVQSNSAPDISWVRSHYLEELARAGAIYRIEHFMQGPNALTQEELDDIYPSLIQYASWGDTLYSVPMEATNLGLVYNKEHFREAGLDPERPPQSWEELRDYTARLTKDTDGDGQIDRAGFMVPAVPADGPQGTYMMWQWLPFLWQAGGYLINEEQTEVLYDHPPGVQALSLWQDIYRAQNQQNFGNEPIVAFSSGQASMFMDGPWNLTRYPKVLHNIDYGIAMLPGGPEKRATVVAGEFLSIFKQSEHPEEAWTFVKWILQPEVQAFWAMESGYLPVRASVMEVEEFQTFLDQNPGHKAFAEQMAYAQAQRPVDYYTLEIQRDLARAIEQATVGNADPATVLAEAARASNARLQSVARK